jgi:hypothetical protein
MIVKLLNKLETLVWTFYSCLISLILTSNLAIRVVFSLSFCFRFVNLALYFSKICFNFTFSALTLIFSALTLAFFFLSSVILAKSFNLFLLMNQFQIACLIIFFYTRWNNSKIQISIIIDKKIMCM